MTAFPRAFRSVGILLACWTGGRAFVMTLPAATGQDNLPGMPPVPRAVPQASEFTGIDVPVVTSVIEHENAQVQRSGEGPSAEETRPSIKALSAPPFEPPKVLAAAVPMVFQPAGFDDTARPPTSSPSAILGQAKPEIRWSASTWTLVRGGGSATGGLAPNGQLGGSQAGARATLQAVEIGQGIEAGPTARVSFALNGFSQREVAAGISVRLNSVVPVEIIAERRVGLSPGMKDRFALLAATGVDDAPLPAGLRASGYAQAGVAGFKERDGFIDGAARMERAVQQTDLGEVRVGANMWGAAQPGASRVDAGPSLSIKTDLLGQPMRISVEYRQRIAGDAAPKSGPALTIGADL